MPLLGHAIQLIRDNLGFIASLRTHYGPLVEITLQPGTCTLIVQDPDLIRTMLTDLGPSLDKGRFFEKMGQLLGDSVVTAAGQKHVRKRRQLQPAFGRPKIAHYVDIMRAETDSAVDTWVPGRQLDVHRAMIRLSLDMLAKTIFADSLDDATFRRLRDDLSVVMNGVGARVMLPDWVERLPLPHNRRFNTARDAVRATIEKAVTELQETGRDTGDMLSLLLRATDEETGRPLTGHQISSEILTLAVAGTETTASVLSWTLYELARNPEVERAVLAELDTVLGSRPIAFADLPHLPYLDRVIREALRLHHTGWLVTRRTVTRTQLGPWSIPAGTELAYCQHALHRDPAFFPDPLTFDPDRWLDDAQAEAFTPGAFLPFGAGKHKCIGDRFALTELVTAISTIIRRVRFAPPPHHQEVRPVAQATVRPSTLLMTAHRRIEPAEQQEP
ncbi:cytochrome P450 [Streptomyces sp. NBC_01708]|uniref:cytochrome P450 n=1 Tax=Streptomyces sp. NBC_01708 TaxID=2975915 RepID=UPI002E2EABE4|nr:cytochrome P450 [Streptomyces sp. NBC_01708]